MMKTNLVQNYIGRNNGVVQNQSTSQASQFQQTPPKKPVVDFNLEQELLRDDLIKPLPSHGHLIKENILSSPVNMVKDFGESLKAVKKAYKGEANDHELGKINNLAMMTGGLAIASYLATKKTVPTTKYMEFVGFASFFASMALWKKIGIQMPAKLIHGVDIDQQYMDNYDRKKPLFLDPQFIPWNLYSPEEMGKLGNKLDVPENLHNRDEYTKEKMRKIAVQSNTLWMLTAGFATPVMSGLICNAVEKPLSSFLVNQRNKQADDILNNFDKHLAKVEITENADKVERLIHNHGDRPLDKKTFATIIKTLTDGIDAETAKAIEKDLAEKMLTEKYDIDEKVIESVVENMTTRLSKTRFKGDIEAVVPNKSQLSEMFKTLDLQSGEYSAEEHFRMINQRIIKLINENISNVNTNNPEKVISEAQSNKIVDVLTNGKPSDNPIYKTLQKKPTTMFDDSAKSILRSYASTMDRFSSETSLLEKYKFLKSGAAQDTVISKYYGDFTEDLMKIFKFSMKEIEQVRIDRELLATLLQSKIEIVCADANEYKKVVSQIAKKMAEIDTLVKPEDVTSYNRQVEKTFAGVVEGFSSDKISMPRTVEALAGKEVFENGESTRKLSGSLRNVFIRAFGDRVDGAKNSFNWFLNMLDLNRRVATDTNTSALHSGLRREVKEDIVALSRKMKLQGHTSDFANKFYFHRNPNPVDDFSPIEVEGGRIVNKYHGKGTNLVDTPHNAEVFKESMKLMFENEMHPETSSILRENNIEDRMTSYRSTVKNIIGNDPYFAKEHHLVDGHKVLSPSDLKFKLLAAAPDEMLSKKSRDLFNSNKWLKMFGGFALGLLAVSTLAQFSFGKMRYPKTTQEGS
ncbi:MAG: hypothetical protein R3Y28_08170 [Candidatus Gastranaerophilales bacterium]